MIQNLKKNISNKNICLNRFLLYACLIIIGLSSCNPTKYVQQDETLLDKNHILISKEGISRGDIGPLIKQKPNKRIFGVRFHLGLYNLSNIKKEKWPHSWLRKIGEEPVIYDPYATAKSVDQIQSYVASKGYFDSGVNDTVKTAKQKSEVFYNVDLKSPYKIRNLYYEFADTIIEKWYFFDSINCLIERGKPYDVDILQAEQSRFEKFIKDRGYYGFSRDHIYFRVDSTVGNRSVDIYYGVRKFLRIDNESRRTEVPHSIYKIRNIYIYPDFVPRDALEGREAYINSLDTTFYEGYYFISPGEKPEIKHDLIIQSLYLKSGSRFSVTNTDQTQSHLLGLKTFRLVNVFYTEVPALEYREGEELELDCNIQLTLLRQQSYKVEVEGTHSDGLGGALNLVYQHKNLFRGAELFNLKLKGAYETLSQDSIMHSVEYGAETSLRFPKFLLPFIKTEGFIKKYNPTTTLLAAYNYQKLPFYTREMANATFGYNWNGNPYTTHIVNPLQLNIVKLDTIDPAFMAIIESSSYLAYSYRDVTILGSSYSLIFSNQSIRKSRDYWFIRFNAETSGNMLSLISNIAGLKKTEGSYRLFRQPFAQYVRADIDLRYNLIINDVSSVVSRAFVGAGIPYGNSQAVPFEKQYFGGGANGIRAWQVRTLGPGSYVPDESKFLNQTADIKIEANAEYRFNLFWILEGAVFLDAGNIWSFNNDPTRPGSQFILKSFYKD
ncbi:MAG: hypothetical protein H6Q23_1722, partial [Bacteroidetes bacterium]|nr:hypothetical protein [Bacteroidota bacterium]